MILSFRGIIVELNAFFEPALVQGIPLGIVTKTIAVEWNYF